MFVLFRLCGATDSAVLTARLPVLAGDVSVELPVRPAAHGADLHQAAVMEEATPEEEQHR